jgi:dynein light chain roadblock-type
MLETLKDTQRGARPQPTSSSLPAMSPEFEQTLSMLSSHRSVLGYMLLSRSHPVSMIRHSGVIFEGEQGKRYAGVVARIVESVQGGLDEIHAGETDGVSFALESM